jgi:hypothetical protein
MHTDDIMKEVGPGTRRPLHSVSLLGGVSRGVIPLLWFYF